MAVKQGETEAALKAAQAALAAKSSDYDEAVRINQQLARQVESLKHVVQATSDQLAALARMLKGA